MENQEQMLKVGDVVSLKSGGPDMTVDNVGQWPDSKERQAVCAWFNGGMPVKEKFALTSLMKIR